MIFFKLVHKFSIWAIELHPKLNCPPHDYGPHGSNSYYYLKRNTQPNFIGEWVPSKKFSLTKFFNVNEFLIFAIPSLIRLYFVSYPLKTQTCSPKELWINKLWSNTTILELSSSSNPPFKLLLYLIFM